MPSKRFLRAISTAAVLSAAFPLFAASDASALRHEWGVYSGNPAACNAVPVDTRCYDQINSVYHHWKSLKVVRYDIGSNRRICQKIISEKGGEMPLAYAACGEGTSTVSNYALYPDTIVTRTYIFWAPGNGSQTSTVGLTGIANTD